MRGPALIVVWSATLLAACCLLLAARCLLLAAAMLLLRYRLPAQTAQTAQHQRAIDGGHGRCRPRCRVRHGMEAGAMIGTQQHLSALADECITAVAEHRGGGQANLHAGIDLGPVQTRVGAAPRVATQA